eukprot:2137042-Prymnesium_polylepis.1
MRGQPHTPRQDPRLITDGDGPARPGSCLRVRAPHQVVRVRQRCVQQLWVWRARQRCVNLTSAANFSSP